MNYADVTWVSSQITGDLFDQPFVQANIKEKLKSALPALCQVNPVGHRWIALTKGQ